MKARCILAPNRVFQLVPRFQLSGWPSRAVKEGRGGKRTVRKPREKRGRAQAERTQGPECLKDRSKAQVNRCKVGFRLRPVPEPPRFRAYVSCSAHNENPPNFTSHTMSLAGVSSKLVSKHPASLSDKVGRIGDGTREMMKI